jgi:hypothetical protein
MRFVRHIKDVDLPVEVRPKPSLLGEQHRLAQDPCCDARPSPVSNGRSVTTVD